MITLMLKLIGLRKNINFFIDRYGFLSLSSIENNGFATSSSFFLILKTLVEFALIGI